MRSAEIMHDANKTLTMLWFEAFSRFIVMFCAIWYRLYNLKNVKNTHGGVLLLEKLLQDFSLQLY